MKLYSKNRIIFSSIISALIAIFLTTVISLTISNHKISKSDLEKNPQTLENEKSRNKKSEENSKVSSINKEDKKANNYSQVSNSKKVEVANSSSRYTQDELQNITVYEQCAEAVVNINTQVTGVNWFLEPVVENGGSGSGSIIDPRGYVVTNVHVISDASKIYISLSDGTQYEGTVIGTDTESDIAVLKFTPPAGTVLKSIDFGDSDALKVGQKVIAIGNPFGLERTMTTGIVSGLKRPIQNSKSTIIRNMIQTDTAINPGNSGGPLLDTSGKMIGINTMIYSSSGNSAGVGFAVPASTARRVVNDLLKYGSVQRGIIQAELVQLNNSIANYARLDINSGVLISKTVPGGNAAEAGIQGGTTAVRYGAINPRMIYLGGDIIIGINGERVSSLADYFSLLENKRPGESVTVTVRRGRKNFDIRVRLVADNRK